MDKPPVKPFGEHHAERIVVQTITHTLRPKSGNRVLVVSEVLRYVKDNLSSNTAEGRVVKVGDIEQVIEGLRSVPEFAGGHRD